MKITVSTAAGEIFNLEVSEDLEVENFKALCQFECGAAANQSQIMFNGVALADGQKPLQYYGLKDGDVVLLHTAPAEGDGNNVRQAFPPSASSSDNTMVPNIDFSSMRQPSPSGGAAQVGQGASGARHLSPEEDPAQLKEYLRANPDQLAILKQRNPRLIEALLSDNLERFNEVLREQQRDRSDRERQRILLLNSDPFDIEAQKNIAEEIRLRNVEANMETAMEHNPESFGQVVMLYIDCIVNGHPVKAFVDSGSQTTIMNQACAERCNIMRLVDTRWAGIAKGVGTQKIIGRVHLGQIQIGGAFLQSSFSILEDQPMDMLLGLDMLKRHQCTIDLKANELKIGTTGMSTPFLSESELPEHARLHNRQMSAEDMDEDRALAQALHKSASETAAPSASGNASESSSSISETDVKKLVEMGFARSLVVEELRKSNGDVNLATVALLAKSFKGP